LDWIEVVQPTHLIDVGTAWKTYGDPKAGGAVVLRGVSLVVEQGGFVALMGASGSGKTTLLNLIGGLDVPDRGEVVVGGTPLQSLKDKARSDFRLRNMGFVFQFFNLLPNLTVSENIALPLLFLGTSRGESHDRARAMADEVGIGDKSHRRVHQLSGGEMQRVAIARALVHGPRLVIADEPTGNLDSKTGTRILELLLSMGQLHGATIVMATHDNAAAAFASRTVRMEDGLIVERASPDKAVPCPG
jgi:putative ABC transport system ATP-binding protein